MKTSLGRFTCNVCGSENDSHARLDDREQATCASCRSSMRFRSVVLALSRAMFGMDLSLCDFPRLKSVSGMGISDSEIYADRLENRFNYLNTFYDRPPAFDLLHPDVAQFGKYDFVICSDVLEHVVENVDRAFDTLAHLLRPGGILIVTVPYTLSSQTVEHFADLHQTGLAEVGGRTVLVNRSPAGTYDVFDQLVFHGGTGSTLEMRMFSESDLRSKLHASGLKDVRFIANGSERFGVVFSDKCSLPIVAFNGPFLLDVAGIGELTEQLVGVRTLLAAVKNSRWVKLGQLFGFGPNLRFPQ